MSEKLSMSKFEKRNFTILDGDKGAHAEDMGEKMRRDLKVKWIKRFVTDKEFREAVIEYARLNGSDLRDAASIPENLLEELIKIQLDSMVEVTKKKYLDSVK